MSKEKSEHASKWSFARFQKKNPHAEPTQLKQVLNRLHLQDHRCRSQLLSLRSMTNLMHFVLWVSSIKMSMVQKALKLNQHKQGKSTQKHKAPKVSKVDILKKKKKKDSNSADSVGAATNAFIKKCGQKTEANVAAKAAVEGNANLEYVKITPQQIAKAEKKIGARQNKKQKKR
eukprot:symbB.v1.2.015345.t1/scaffold1094.1/size138377/10